MRVVFSPSGLSSRPRYMAVASPSMFGLVQRITSSTPSGSMRASSSLHPQLIGADALDRADGPLEHVVAAVELAGLLDRHEVPGLLDDADRRAVAPVVGADPAQVALADVEAPRHQRTRSRASLITAASRRASSRGHLQQVERDALRRLRARRPAGGRARRSGPGPPRRRRPTSSGSAEQAAEIEPTEAERSRPGPRCTRDIASCSAASTRSWSISTSSGSTGAGSIVTDWNSMPR